MHSLPKEPPLGEGFASPPCQGKNFPARDFPNTVDLKGLWWLAVPRKREYCRHECFYCCRLLLRWAVLVTTRRSEKSTLSLKQRRRSCAGSRWDAILSPDTLLQGERMPPQQMALKDECRGSHVHISYTHMYKIKAACDRTWRAVAWALCGRA